MNFTFYESFSSGEKYNEYKEVRDVKSVDIVPMERRAGAVRLHVNVWNEWTLDILDEGLRQEFPRLLVVCPKGYEGVEPHATIYMEPAGREDLMDIDQRLRNGRAIVHHRLTNALIVADFLEDDGLWMTSFYAGCLRAIKEGQCLR